MPITLRSARPKSDEEAHESSYSILNDDHDYSQDPPSILSRGSRLHETDHQPETSLESQESVSTQSTVLSESTGGKLKRTSERPHRRASKKSKNSRPSKTRWTPKDHPTLKRDGRSNVDLSNSRRRSLLAPTSSLEPIEDDREDDAGEGWLQDYDGDSDGSGLLIDPDELATHDLVEQCQGLQVESQGSQDTERSDNPFSPAGSPVKPPPFSRTMTQVRSSQQSLDDSDDDARELARLMERHIARANGEKQAESQVAGKQAVEQRVQADMDGNQRAIAFLESLMLDFTSQMLESSLTLNAKEKLKLEKMKNSRRKSKQQEDPLAPLGEKEVQELEEMSNKDVGITLSLKNRKTGGEHVTRFPDDPVLWSEHPENANSMLRISRILAVASLMYDAAVTGVTTTKRDIFYKDVRLFGTQAVVDTLVDDIVATAGLKRRHFNVCATSKGLVASSCLKMVLKSGETVDLSPVNATLIPPAERIERIDTTADPRWVLIVEKDAIFQSLCSMRLLEDERLGPGVLVTGKGYPDLATLQLLALLAAQFPAATFHCLVDADPHGIDILSVYTHGSQSSRHSHDHMDLPLRGRLQWLGVRASEWIEIGVRHDDLLPLTEKDVQKAMAMLRDRINLSVEYRRELVHILHLHRKAEIQIILGADPQSSLAEDGSGAIWQETDRDASGGNVLLDYILERILR